MRVVITLAVLALFAAVAVANPVVNYPAVGVTFDPTGAEYPRIDPTPYSLGNFYVMFMYPGPEMENLQSISFAVVLDPWVGLSTSITNQLPGGLSVGDWETGTVLTSTVPLYDVQVLVCSGTTVWTGGAGEIRILDHPEYPRSVTNADDEVFYYYVATNGGVFLDPTPTGESAGWWVNPANPVENSSWGAIKALYR